MTPEQEALHGQRAAEVLSNEAYQAAFTQINDEIYEQWKNAPARDTDGRERLWLMQSLLAKLQGTLEAAVQGGHKAKLDLQHKQTLLERMRGT